MTCTSEQIEQCSWCRWVNCRREIGVGQCPGCWWGQSHSRSSDNLQCPGPPLSQSIFEAQPEVFSLDEVVRPKLAVIQARSSGWPLWHDSRPSGTFVGHRKRHVAFVSVCDCSSVRPGSQCRRRGQDGLDHCAPETGRRRPRNCGRRRSPKVGRHDQTNGSESKSPKPHFSVPSTKAGCERGPHPPEFD